MCPIRPIQQVRNLTGSNPVEMLAKHLQISPHFPRIPANIFNQRTVTFIKDHLRSCCDAVAT
jgi:hypothetical protein